HVLAADVDAPHQRNQARILCHSKAITFHQSSLPTVAPKATCLPSAVKTGGDTASKGALFVLSATMCHLPAARAGHATCFPSSENTGWPTFSKTSPLRVPVMMNHSPPSALDSSASVTVV